MHLNHEFKAKTSELARLEKLLVSQNPRYIGEDLQTDTYFNVNHGRLKLREGNIENALIQYFREDLAGSKTSHVTLYRHSPNEDLKMALEKSLGVKVVVRKKRRIYFVKNVKFHFDHVEGLGEFVEVEAIDMDGNIGIEALQQQCRYYEKLFGIDAKDFINVSYSDMLLAVK